MTYQDGFEDATELCLKELQEAKTKAEAGHRIQYLLSLAKEDKMKRLKQMLGVI